MQEGEKLLADHPRFGARVLLRSLRGVGKPLSRPKSVLLGRSAAFRRWYAAFNVVFLSGARLMACVAPIYA